MKTLRDCQADATYYAALAGRQGALVAITIAAMTAVKGAYVDPLPEHLRQGAMKAWRLAEMAVANGYDPPARK